MSRALWKKQVLTGLAAFIVLWLGFEAFQFTSNVIDSVEQKRRPRDFLRVLTLNTWNCQGDFKKRAALIRQCVAAAEPDIIAFQEVLRYPGFDPLEALGGTTWPHSVYAQAHSRRKWIPDFADQELGNAILSKWPITASEELKLPVAPGQERRVAIQASIKAPRGSINVITTHLSHRHDETFVRQRQVLALAEAAKDVGTNISVVMGDFNADPRTDEIRFMTGRHGIRDRKTERTTFFQDAMDTAGLSTATWNHEHPYNREKWETSRRIDYVFVAPPASKRTMAGKVERAAVTCWPVDNTLAPSDHLAVVADIAWE
mmetsp:Transcript_1753/g.3492  ORF Transcript_1753/g.3492 Transcript_1753/m.3492 type:complete len:316 (+) Transcript_1753:37-984(+)